MITLKTVISTSGSNMSKSLLGEASEDSNVIFFYSNGSAIVALEIRNLKEFA